MPHAWGAGEFPTGTSCGSMPADEIRSVIERRLQEKELPEAVSALGSLGHEPESVIKSPFMRSQPLRRWQPSRRLLMV